MSGWIYRRTDLARPRDLQSDASFQPRARRPCSPESLVEAIQQFESVEGRFSPVFIRAHVQRFDVSRFKKEMFEFIADKLHGLRLQDASNAQ